MSNESILLFLHGVGSGDQEDHWMVGLTQSLERLGYPNLESLRVIAPKYAHALKGSDEPCQLPGLTIKQPLREAAKKNRREFERRIGALEYRLGRHDRGSGYFGGDVAVNASVELPLFRQAHNYLNNPKIRAQVLDRILGKLPESGRLVIVGHSLGSVIAADIVRRLPVGLEVAGMVTIGSPLANGAFDMDKLRDTLSEPPTNLAWWVNFWNVADPVAAHRGVSSAFPWMIDFRINTKALPFTAHAAAEYLANDAVAAAIGFALYGSKTTEVAQAGRGLDIPLDATEHFALLALRYAYLMKTRLEGERKDRFAGALRQVQAAAVEDIRKRNLREGRAMPSEVARLEFDVSDPETPVPEPLPSSHITKEDAVVLLTVLAAENVIRPFEISIPRKLWQEAMEDLAAEMGLGGQYGADVFVAAKNSQDALSGSRGVNWIKWGALGAGAAAIVVATGGLALAAAPGLAGAAVITSALASFGPGGMIGGLLTAGTLVTAGGGGIAYGLASPGTTAETLVGVIERRLAAAILRQRQHLDPDEGLWAVLVETEIEVRREHERLDEFSDASAPALKELKRKIEAIERALKYLTDHGLEPRADSPQEDEYPTAAFSEREPWFSKQGG
ncbi:pimeloyl-ACP methyl ester carboxylesterase [Paenarthrobacter nicotinovorans]|uniref:alpha/beta hydrolase n=1 Tax=Micrococcaceae TaxID=1268 RepID=UPI0015877D0A|nr:MULTISPECIES: alpha/beta hydrolase [Micrococcaceae]MDR6437051.1 pimeloyl-ACP methyl ester carboxylesterase [Paenarthrobacter nicotinovorans]